MSPKRDGWYDNVTPFLCLYDSRRRKKRVNRTQQICSLVLALILAAENFHKTNRLTFEL